MVRTGSKTCALALALLAPCLLRAQSITEPTIGKPINAINTILYDANGTGDGHCVDITFVKTYLAKLPDTETVVANCHNDCKGKKHQSHDKCDLSCDTPCPGTPPAEGHVISIPLFTFENVDQAGRPAPNKNFVTQLNRDYERMGLPYNSNAREFLPPTIAYHMDTDGLWSNFVKNAKKPESRDQPGGLKEGCAGLLRHHWNNTPCSSSPLKAKVKHFLVRVDYVLINSEHHKQDGGMAMYHDPNPTVLEEGPKGTFFLIQNVVDPYSLTEGAPIVNCLCDPKPSDKPVDHGYIPGVTPLDEGQAYVMDMGTKRPMTQTDLNTCIGDISVPNMNHALFTPASWLMTTYHVPAGWQLVSESGNVQNVQIQDPFDLGPAGLDSLLASLKPKNPLANLEESVDVRVLCMNMLRHEPNTGEKFRLVPPANPAIAKLAQITHGSRFRGPWDQIRLWIATDHATYEDIGKILRPLPTKARYLYELGRALQAGAVGQDDKDLAKMAPLSMLLEDNVRAEDAQWLVSYHLQNDAKATRSFLTKNATKLPSAENIKLPDRDAEPNRLTAVAQALLSTASPEDKKALKDILTKLPADLQDPEKCDAAWLAAHAAP